MSAAGRTCRKTRDRAQPDPETLDIEQDGDTVIVRVAGRVVRRVNGVAATALLRRLERGSPR